METDASDILRFMCSM